MTDMIGTTEAGTELHIDKVAVLGIRDGDILVYRTDAHLSRAAFDNVHVALRQLVEPHDVRVGVIDKGGELGVLRYEDWNHG